MKRALTVLLLLTSTASAGTDSGTIQNWRAFASAIGPTNLIIAPHVKDPSGATARGIIDGGRFRLIFDDRAAARMSEPAPACPTVTSTPGLRVTLFTALAVRNATTLYQLTRETTRGGTRYRDAYVYASRAGRITGRCTAEEETTTYNVTLASGWNVVRLTNNLTRPQSSVTNVPGTPLPWTLSK